MSFKGVIEENGQDGDSRGIQGREVGGSEQEAQEQVEYLLFLNLTLADLESTCAGPQRDLLEMRRGIQEIGSGSGGKCTSSIRWHSVKLIVTASSGEAFNLQSSIKHGLITWLLHMRPLWVRRCIITISIKVLMQLQFLSAFIVRGVKRYILIGR